MSSNQTTCSPASELAWHLMAYTEDPHQASSGYKSADELPGIDIDTVKCIECGVDGLGEDEMKSYTSNRGYIAAHEDCMTKMRKDEAFASRVTKQMNTALFWVNMERKHQSKTPPTWVPSGKLTCDIGGGEIPPGSLTSVPGSHQFGEQRFCCKPCVDSAKSFTESMWRGCSRPKFFVDLVTGERVVAIPDIEFETGTKVKVFVSEKTFEWLHDTVHTTVRNRPCEVPECEYLAATSDDEDK